MHQASEAFRSRVIYLVFAAPAGRNKHAEQKQDGIYEEHASGLCDGYVEGSDLLPVHFFHYLIRILLSVGVLYNQVVWPRSVSVSVGFLRESGAAEDMPTRRALHDNGKMDDGIARDVPVV